jgi:hypothetical protein
MDLHLGNTGMEFGRRIRLFSSYLSLQIPDGYATLVKTGDFKDKYRSAWGEVIVYNRYRPPFDAGGFRIFFVLFLLFPQKK